MTSTTDANINKTQYVYDDAGRRTQVIDALNHTTFFTYDAAGQQTSVEDANQHTTQYVYDDAGRRKQTIYPDQTTETIGYDALGRMTSKTDQANKTTQYGYDPLGRLTSVTQFLNGNPLVTSYGYDEVGNRTSQTDANNHTTTYAYDQLGRRTSRMLPLGQSESYVYDAAGNLKSKTDFNGHTTTYAYDNMNRLLSKTADNFFSTGACAGGACGATSVSFTYTNTGRRKTMTDASGGTSYTYDIRDRLQTKQTPEGTLTYTYDNAGDVKTIASSNANGASMSYTYDPLNRLSTVVDAAGTTNYSYDPAGNLQSFTYPNGVSHSYTYDNLNRLTNLSVSCGTGAPNCGPGGASSGNAFGYAYTLGAAGNRTKVTELSGRTVQYGYDDLYRLTSETIAGATSQNGTIGYTYDAVGNRKQITSTVAAIPSSGTLNYDANDRTATDTYDNDGNTVAQAGIANTYDFENHLVQHGAVTIVYDGDGNRVSETAGGITTKYLVDTQNPTGYAQVVDELQGGAVARNYTWGLTLLSKLETGNSKRSFYGLDGHGSVRSLTDATGMVTDTYDYDAFGNLIARSGSTANNYLFAGEQFDPNLGLYYNRARYLDVRSGRFWGMDPAPPQTRNPETINRFTYAGNNAPDKTDRSGLEFDVGSTVAEIGIDEGIQMPGAQVGEQLLEAVEDPEVVAEAPQTFTLAQRAIASLLIGTVALGTAAAVVEGSGGQLPDSAQQPNYDIYRFGNAQGTAPLRLGDDYDLNGRGNVDPQNPFKSGYKGASAYRNPYTSGLTGVVWRTAIQFVFTSPNLSVIEDGQDVMPGSGKPVGHHTIFPTTEMSADQFEQAVRNLGWIRVPGRVK